MEIDLIEEKSDKLHGYEFKWKKAGLIAPKDFMNAYPESGYTVINQDNYLNFIS